MKIAKMRYLILCFGVLLFALVTSSSSFAEGKSDIEKSEQTISSNQQKIKELQDAQSELKAEMNRLNALKQDTAAYIKELDKKQSQLSQRIEALNGEIAATEERIKEAEAELLQTEELLRQQKASMALRIRFIYESDQGGMLETLMCSENLAELLNNVEYIRRISEADRTKLDEFTGLFDRVTTQKTELETEKTLLDEQKAAVSEDLAACVQMASDKSKEIKNFESQINAADQKVSELSRDVSGLKAAIKAEEDKIAAIEAELKRKEEEAKRKAKENNKEYKIRSIGELSFLWPVPASSRITSRFGDREAPVEGASTSHKGIDIGAEEGSSIKAAESGTVVIASYSQSAGNYVMISHGGGVYTVYMHLSEIYVSEDEEVSKGDTIGTVGSTGYSTGPHLHFGIRIDGSYDDPLNYVAP